MVLCETYSAAAIAPLGEAARQESQHGPFPVS
jgi:hypothetical protein